VHINPYLFFNGDCEAAFKFYEKCLGAEIRVIMPHEGTPAAGQVPAEWQKKVLHATLEIGDDLLMASDAPPGRYQKPDGFSVALNLKDIAQAERIYTDLSEGGSVQMPLQETFWAARFAMLNDRFGIPWMINCEKAV